MRKSFLTLLLIVLLPFGLSHATASDSRSASAQYRKANDLFAAGRYRDALSLYQQSLSAPPQGVSPGDIQSRIGDSYLQLSEFGNALAAYRAAINNPKESERPVTQYWIGFSCFLLGRDSEAVTEFLKIPELYPASGMWVSTAYYWAGRACERMGDGDRAAQFYQKAGGNGRSTQSTFALKKAAAVKRSK